MRHTVSVEELDEFREQLGLVAVADAKPRTLYVRRNVLNADDVIAWAEKQGFQNILAADDLHVTVAYSKAQVDWTKFNDDWYQDEQGRVRIPPGGPRVVEPLGKEGAVVLMFSSSKLASRHRDLCEGGCSWDYPEYHPHVTISYDPGITVTDDSVEPYRGELLLGPEIFEEVVAGGYHPGDGYDEDQPRDEGGQWTSGGSGSKPRLASTRAKSLNDSERNSISDYIENHHRNMNKRLRSGSALKGDDLIRQQHMDNAIAKSELSKDTTLYRAIKGDPADFKDMKVGSRYVDRGFMSTSTEIEGAVSSQEVDQKKLSLVKINAPKGTAALSTAGLGDSGHESEVILPRNTQLKLVSKSGDGGYTFDVVKTPTVTHSDVSKFGGTEEVTSSFKMSTQAELSKREASMVRRVENMSDVPVSKLREQRESDFKRIPDPHRDLKKQHEEVVKGFKSIEAAGIKSMKPSYYNSYSGSIDPVGHPKFLAHFKKTKSYIFSRDSADNSIFVWSHEDLENL